jgi:hypothetical protein
MGPATLTLLCPVLTSYLYKTSDNDFTTFPLHLFRTLLWASCIRFGPISGSVKSGSDPTLALLHPVRTSFWLCYVQIRLHSVHFSLIPTCPCYIWFRSQGLRPRYKITVEEIKSLPEANFAAEYLVWASSSSCKDAIK